MKVYLDHAASTPLHPEVLEVMTPYWSTYYGNPSAIHGYGRQTRNAIEQSRKQMSRLLGAAPAEIFFTSGGTESNYSILQGSIQSLGVQHIITSPIEHAAVLQPVKYLAKIHKISYSLVKLDAKGHIDYAHLEHLLQQQHGCGKVLVSLMHVNNEIGNITDLQRIGDLCKHYKAYFHSDTVQSMGHLPLDVSTCPVDFLVGSAHKLQGPKGIGFVYIRQPIQLNPWLLGSQERYMRGGTEHVSGIVGMNKALSLAYEHLDSQHQQALQLKQFLITQLKENFPHIIFHGDSEDLTHSLAHLLNIQFPGCTDHTMLLYQLDIHGIAVSAGSACASGTSTGSSVLTALPGAKPGGGIRLSWGPQNTLKEMQYTMDTLVKILKK